VPLCGLGPDGILAPGRLEQFAGPDRPEAVPAGLLRRLAAPVRGRPPRPGDAGPRRLGFAVPDFVLVDVGPPRPARRGVLPAWAEQLRSLLLWQVTLQQRSEVVLPELLLRQLLGRDGPPRGWVDEVGGLLGVLLRGERRDPLADGAPPCCPFAP